MITDHLVLWGASFVAWVGGLISLPDPPSFLEDLAGWAATASGYVASTEVWMPWPLMVVVIGVYGVCLGAGIAVKLIRIVASFVTLGGGSAA